MRTRSTMLVIVTFMLCLLILTTATTTDIDQHDTVSTQQLGTSSSAPSKWKIPNLPDPSASKAQRSADIEEEVPMVKRVYPARIQHHHHYHRPVFTDYDRAVIRSQPTFLGRAGMTVALGAAHLVGTGIAVGICESSHIWAPALGRCILRAADCVGNACDHISDGVSRVTASVRARKEALSNRLRYGEAPARIQAPPQGDRPAATVGSAPTPGVAALLQHRVSSSARSTSPEPPALQPDDHSLSASEQEARHQAEMAYIRARQERLRRNMDRRSARRRAAAARRASNAAITLQAQRGESSEIGIGIGKGKGILKTPRFKKDSYYAQGSRIPGSNSSSRPRSRRSERAPQLRQMAV